MGKCRSKLWTCASAAALLACAQGAGAQTSAAGPGPATPPSPAPAATAPEADRSGNTPQTDSSGAVLAEVIVTAQKRAEPLQKVPGAITAFNAAQLAQFGFSDPLALTRQTPALNIEESNGQTKPNVYLRGIGSDDFNATASPAVGFYVDEVYEGLQSNQIIQIFDLDRIEVLRGPQGTLYGRNTSGGAVNFFTCKPDGTTGGNLQLSYGEYNALDIEGGVQFPIVGDKLSARVSGVFRSSDGNGTNYFNGSSINGYDTYALRGVVRFAPDSDQEWLLNLHGARVSGDGPRYHFQRVDNGKYPDAVLPIIGVAAPYKPPGGFWDGSWDLPQYELDYSYGASLSGRVQLGDLTLHIITDYENVQSGYRLDSDASPLDYVDVVYTDRDYQISQEFRLESPAQQKLSWIVGLYYYTDEVRAANDFNIGQFARDLFGEVPDINDPTAPEDVGQFYTQRTTSYAAFASATLKLTDKLKVIGGVRYTLDHKTLRYLTTTDALPGTPLIDLKLNHSWDAPTGNFVFDYEYSRNILLYASYNRGFKSGVFNASPFFDPTAVNSAGPEQVNAYEVGVKSQLFGRQVTLNISAFYNDFSNLQVFQFLPDPATGIPTSRYSNSATAGIKGVEIELHAQPTPQLYFQVASSFLDATYSSFKTQDEDTGAPADYSGNRLVGAPKVNLSGAAEYRIALPRGFQLIPRYEFTYNSKQYFSPSDEQALSQDAYSIHNASVRVEPPNKAYSVSLWVKNFTGERYNNFVLPLTDFGLNGEIRGERQSFGFTVSGKF